jgi:prolyl oligopeptidase
MNSKILILISMVLLLGCQTKQKLHYPETKKVDTVDVYFGQEVADPYRWLEDDNSEETKAWVIAQNEVTFGYLEQIPFREKIKERLTEIWDYPKTYSPFKEGGQYFRYKNNGLQNQDVIYKIESLDDMTEEIFFDPNTLSEDGTVSLTTFDFSKDGRYFAYAVSRGGSDWREFFIKDLETGELLDDHIMWAKNSGMSWYKNGFFYSRFPEPKEGDQLKGENKNSKVYYHKVGTSQDEDKLIYEETENPERSFYASVTEDEKFLILYVMESTTGNMIYFKDLENKNSGFQNLVDNFDNDYSPVDHINGKLLVKTNFNAPKYKLVCVDVNNFGQENWVDIIPEGKGVLSSVSIVGGKIFAKFFEDVHDIIKVYDLKGTYLYNVDLPTEGSVGGFGGDMEDEFTFFSFRSYTFPYTAYKYDIKENTFEIYSKLDVDFNSEEYETHLEFCESKDGTKVPMYIVHKKGIELDGNNPTLMYGYGGFNVTYEPYFSTSNIIWLENGGIYVNAHIRGGGEYGEEWHMAGTKLQKQNVYDDFISVAEYLIEKKYTNPKKLAMRGGSNGGLLLGAVANQRPDLFAVSFPAVGVMDMLRYHKFTIGRYWATDYGTSEESEEMFKYLLNYSPIHTIKENVEYPATMITTADHDDRVVPAHSFKYAAVLQEKYKGYNPVIIRIETNAGHGAGKPTSKVIEEITDQWSFAFYNMGVTPKY